MIPDDIAELPDYWTKIREPLAAGDRDEAVKRLRLFVDHDPFALAPRHVLASLLADGERDQLALLQFEKLLTAAVTCGDLFRAIAAQRRVDERAGRRPDPASYVALHRWFRLSGEANLLPAKRGADAALSPVRLLRMPPEVFVWVAIESRLQRVETGLHIEPLDGACQWNLMWGALRWEAGRRTPNLQQQHAIEGDWFVAVSDPADRAPLRIAADLPSEALVFDSAMLRRLATVDPSVVAGHEDAGFIHEGRTPVIPRPGTSGDLDAWKPAPRAPAGEAPPTLSVEPVGRAAGPAPADDGQWLEPGLIPAEEGGDSTAASQPSQPVAEIPGLERGTTSFAGKTARPDPKPERRPPPRGRWGELELPSEPIPEAPGAADAADPAEFGTIRFDDPPSGSQVASPDPDARRAEDRDRRGPDRTPVDYRGRVRLMGLGHALGVELDCQVADLSPSGMRIELPAEGVLPLVRMLEGETLRIELEPDHERLELAGRVCWLDVKAGDSVRVGLEFALLTRSDSRALRGLIARARADAGSGAPAGPEGGPSTGAAA